MVSIKDETFDEKYCFGNRKGDKIFWNISKMRTYIKNNIVPVKYFKINDLYEFNESSINQEYAAETDYKIPGITVELIRGKLFYKLIDGNHRLYKAKLSGEETFDCYYFTFDEQMKFVVDINNKPISEEEYYNVVEKALNG